MAKKTQIYLDNVLNRYDNYTYNWAIHMVHPRNAHRFEKNISAMNVKTIAHSGVESEVNIESVEQIQNVAFKSNQDRSSLANMFGITLTEPGGATLFTRIVKAARDLEIENHLSACYLLELKFLGYDQNGNSQVVETGPFYYMTSLMNLTFNYADGSTTYTGDFIETHQDAYKTQNLYINGQTDDITASNFGEFLEKLEDAVNKQEKDSTTMSPSKLLYNSYKLGCLESDWLTAAFGATSASGDTSMSSVSVTGEGTLNFSIKPGTSISDAMVVALMQTEYFRKLPTMEGGFHKDHPDDGTANPASFKDLSQWFIFDNEVVYGAYDTLAKTYRKTISYNLHKFVVPELSHDAESYTAMLTNSATQKGRLSKIIQNGLLRKRFDFTYTGMNTEVLGLDVTLNNTYYTIQALNSGALASRASAISGASGSEDQLSVTKTEAIQLKSRIQENNNNIAKEKTKINSVEARYSESGSPHEDAAIERDMISSQERIVSLENENIRLEEEYNDVADANQAAQAAFIAGENTRQISSVANRYITQSELTGIATQNNQENELPVSFVPLPITSKATSGPDTGDSPGSIMLGAVELNLNKSGDLIQTQIQVRGDPYWLGKPKSAHNVLGSPDKSGSSGANYQIGGCSYFLNMNFPTYPNPETGFMEIPEANYGIIGLYRVVRVVSNYANGQFNMTLEAFRDMSSNIGLIWEEITTGQVDFDEIRTEDSFKPGLPDDDDGDEVIPPSGTDEDLGVVTDGTANGTVTESQSSATTRVQPIQSDLKDILQTAATASGLDVVVFSGGQPDILSGGPRVGSTRHDNGHAADVHLFTGTGANKRQLSLNNPADVPLIQNFIIESKRAGATGIGAGNGYMGDTGIHVDNAAKYGQADPTASFWGGRPDNQGRIRSANAPAWLKTIMTG